MKLLRLNVVLIYAVSCGFILEPPVRVLNWAAPSVLELTSIVIWSHLIYK